MKSCHSLLLCTVYALYLVLGAVVFMYLEYRVEKTTLVTEPPEWTHLKDLALREGPPVEEEMLLSLVPWLPRACPALHAHTLEALVTHGSQAEAVRQVEAACPHLHQVNEAKKVIYPWTFVESLYFAMTVTTTIGYGHLSPTQSGGRIMCILYSLVGIPLTGILLAWTSGFFGEKLFQLYKSKLDEEKQRSHTFIAAATFIYVALGFIVFIFIPAGVFTTLEDWSYLEGVYYSYITLTTIGFGDFVSGNEYEGTSLAVYHIGVILWIMVGLGYWVMVANFITKALKSKRLKSSVKRSAEEMKKLMTQVGLKNHDPTFLTQHSKATVNLMLQLSNILAAQDTESKSTGMKDDDACDSPGTASTEPSSPPLSPVGIPGISALFGAGLSRTTPLSHLMGPLRKEEKGEGMLTEEYTAVTVSLI